MLTQAVINIGAVVGVLPVTGVPLPFVSFGGSSLIVLLAAPGSLSTSDADRTSSAASPRSPAVRALIAAGGTGGHVMPALAVADALRARGAEVSFVGARRAGASGVVRGGGLPPGPAPAARLRAPADAAEPLVALAQAALAAPRAASLLAPRRPHVVIGGGGYVAGPVALAAWLTRRPADADGGRLAPRRGQPPGRAAGEAGDAGLPARRPHRAAATW